MPSLSGDNFPQFEVLSEFSDHYHAKRRAKLTPSSHKKIMKEWNLLSKELPESIYVRVSETRVDLMRAAIVGVCGTPYQDGLFFFDIAFPSDYPMNPPLVHYYSFGYQIHPSVYNNGDLCLSLLDSPSFFSYNRDKWDANQSSVFQVLLSIQALVLTDLGEWTLPTLLQWEPIPYNEKVFVLSCKTMLHVLRAPPGHFEPLVKRHFIDRAESILEACNAFREGQFDGVVKREQGQHRVSDMFRESMNELYGDLLVALARNGASLGRLFEQQLREEEEERRKEMEEKGGISFKEVRKSVVKKLKKVVQSLDRWFCTWFVMV